MAHGHQTLYSRCDYRLWTSLPVGQEHESGRQESKCSTQAAWHDSHRPKLAFHRFAPWGFWVRVLHLRTEHARKCTELVCVWVIARAFNITGTQRARVFEKEVALFEPLFFWSSCFGPCFSKSTSKYVQLKSHKVHGVQMFQEQPLHCHSALLSTSWIDTFFYAKRRFPYFSGESSLLCWLNGVT